MFRQQYNSFFYVEIKKNQKVVKSQLLLKTDEFTLAYENQENITQSKQLVLFALDLKKKIDNLKK
jgi:hypothetical protein